MKIKSILGYTIGTIAAITGLGSLISGCSEDANVKPVVKVSQKDLEDCCGTDKQSASYNSCVANYQRNGICSSSGHQGTVNPPIYGMPPTLNPNDAAACCGSDTNAKNYNACIQKMYNACPADMSTPQADFDKCIANYKDVNSCSVEPPPQTDYGMPPSIDQKDAEACCGTDYDSKEYKNCIQKMYNACPADMSTPQEDFDKCIAQYKEANACGEIIAPEYGMPLPEIDPNDAKACCGSYSGKKYDACIENMYDACPQASQKEFNACIANYKEVNSCSVEPPPQTDYGMPPSIDQEDAEACCGTDYDSKEYKNCIKKMYNSCPADMSTPQEEFDKCIAEYKKVNNCKESIVTEYGVQPAVDEQDILECCGPAVNTPEYGACVDKMVEACGDSNNYAKCIAEYKITNECGGIAVPEYGMLPVLDPSDAEACCGSDTSSKEYQKCVQKMYDKCPAHMGMSQKEFDECIDNYKEVNSCSIEPPPQTDYGMPPVLSAEDAEACCGKDTESQAYMDCVKKMYESCPANMSTPQEDFDKCIEEFKKVNDCAPIMTLYGMPSPPDE